MFIPVLPSSLIDFVCSPLPYIIGLNPASCKQFDDMEMEEAVIINLDKGKFLKKVRACMCVCVCDPVSKIQKSYIILKSE